MLSIIGAQALYLNWQVLIGDRYLIHQIAQLKTSPKFSTVQYVNSAYSLNTYTISCKLCHYILNFLKILEPIPTLMEAKAPVGRHVRSTYDLLILLDHCLRLRTKEEVKIKNTLESRDKSKTRFTLHE